MYQCIFLFLCSVKVGWTTRVNTTRQRGPCSFSSRANMPGACHGHSIRFYQVPVVVESQRTPRIHQSQMNANEKDLIYVKGCVVLMCCSEQDYVWCDKPGWALHVRRECKTASSDSCGFGTPLVMDFLLGWRNREWSSRQERERLEVVFSGFSLNLLVFQKRY